MKIDFNYLGANRIVQSNLKQNKNTCNNTSPTFNGKFILSGNLKSLQNFMRLTENIKFDDESLFFSVISPTYRAENPWVEVLCTKGYDAICAFDYFFNKHSCNYIEDYDKIISGSAEEIAAYHSAIKSNTNKWADIVISGIAKGRKDVKTIYKNEEVKVIKPEDAIKAYQAGKLDFETGTILK